MKAVAIGECMVEIGVAPDGASARLSYGGDTLNTAVYLARQGLEVDYATALGDDPYSDAMLELWRREGIGTGLVRRLPGRLPGLYMIRTDAQGERSFHYWRDRAAARALFDGPEGAAMADRLAGYDLVYLSGITLSIYAEPARDRLHAALADARRRGARIAFDGNFRPRGWPDPAAARAVFDRFLGLADIALPTFDDERALYGDAAPEATVERLRRAGIGEIAVKLGAEGCRIGDRESAAHVPVPATIDPVDTTAAGDSFNAAYLAARLAGLDPAAAARRGHLLAGIVIRHRGALAPREAMPDFAARRGPE